MFPPHTRVCITAFILAFGTTLSYHATPFYAFDHLGGDARMSGNFGAVQSVVYVLTSLASVRLIGRAQRGFDLALVGTTLFAIFYGVVPFISSPTLCILSSAVGLGGMALTWPAFHSWIGGETDPVQRARHMSWLNMGWSSGAAISPLFAGPLYDLDYRYPFIGSVLFSVVVILIVRTVPHEHAHFGQASQEQLDARADHDRSALTFLWPAWLSVFLVHALGAALRNVYPKRVDDLVSEGALRWLHETDAAAFLSHNPATIFGLLAFAYNFGTAAAFFGMGRTQGWKLRYSAMLWPQMAAMVAMYLLATTHSLIVMALAGAAVGAALGMCFFGSSYYNLADPALKHRRSAFNEGMVGSGAFVGSFAFGQVASRLGAALPFLYAPIGIAIMLVAEYAALRYARRRA